MFSKNFSKAQNKNPQQWIIVFLGDAPISSPAVSLHANLSETGAKLVLFPLSRKAVGGRSCRLGSRRRGILPRNGARNSESCEQGEECFHGPPLLSPRGLGRGTMGTMLALTTPSY